MELFEYIGVEKTQLLVSITKLGDTLAILKDLDNLFQGLLPETIKYIDDKQFLLDIINSWLFRFVHTHLYISTINLLRLHISECFSSTRAAIDATLSAYVITKEPNRTAEYIEFNKKKENIFLNIKRYVNNQNEKEASTYPLAPPLIASHEMCSQFGSHADFAVSFNRLDMTQAKDQGQIRVGYFQNPPNDDVFHQYYLKTIDTYLKMLMVFYEGCKKREGAKELQWDNAKESLLSKLRGLEEKYFANKD